MNNTYSLNDMGLEQIEAANTAIDDINSGVVNLMFIGVDRSGSMSNFSNDMINCLNEFKAALKDSKEADDILVARADFNDVIVVGGYKKVDDFLTDYYAGGMTSLYDVVIDGANKLMQYRDVLKSQGIVVRAVFAIFSDGDDTSSHANVSEARNKILELNGQEITTAFIAFGGAAENIADQLGFMNKKQVGANASDLRKAFNVLSKSLITNSKRVDTGATDQFFGGQDGFTF
jgi:hypothetical protein